MAAVLSLPVLIGLIAVALAFDFLNGLHDTANSIATIVSTRMLRPRYAVIWAAFFNFIAFLVVRRACGADRRRRHRLGRRDRCARDLRRADGRDLLEPDHLVGRYSVQQLACADRRTGRAPASPRPASRSIVWPGLLTTGAFIVLSPLLGFLLALAAGARRVMGVRARQSALGRADIPMAAIRRRLADFARPRRQRRAEDHGHHCRAAVLARSSRRRISTCRSGW